MDCARISLRPPGCPDAQSASWELPLLYSLRDKGSRAQSGSPQCIILPELYP